MKKKFSLAPLAAAIAASAVFAHAPAASAHGGNPRAWGIIVEPGNEQDIIARSDFIGFFRTQDGGKTWVNVCSEVYGTSSYAGLRVALVIAPGGRVLVAPTNSGLYYSDDMCDWTESPAFQTPETVNDIIFYAGNLYTIVTHSVPIGDAQVSIVGLLYKSTDNGDTWSKFGSAMPGDFYPQTMGIAPSDPNRIYVAGGVLNAQNEAVEVSADGGKTWTRSNTTIQPPMMDGTLRIAQIHPTNADVVFLWNDGVETAGGAYNPDEYWFTTDAGKNGASSWKKLYQGTGDDPGFAISPDLSTVLVAGQIDGINSASLPSVLSSGEAMTQVNPGHSFGLNWRSDGTLLAGGDDFSRPFCTLCSSKNDGQTLSTVMTLCDVKFPTQCGPNTKISQLCLSHGPNAPGPWDNPGVGTGGYVQDYSQGSLCVGDGSISAIESRESKTGGDASTGSGPDPVPPSSKSSGGCSYSSETSRDVTGRLGALGLLAFASAARRKKKGQPRSSSSSATCGRHSSPPSRSVPTRRSTSWTGFT